MDIMKNMQKVLGHCSRHPWILGLTVIIGTVCLVYAYFAVRTPVAVTDIRWSQSPNNESLISFVATNTSEDSLIADIAVDIFPK